MSLIDRIRRKSKEVLAWQSQELCERGLLPAHRGFTRFVIVSEIRTGSTMLTSYMDHHPNIRCFFEPFHLFQGNVPFGVSGYHARGVDQATVKLRNEDPARFAEEVLWAPVPKQITAVGFKLLYTQRWKQRRFWHGEEFAPDWEHVGGAPIYPDMKSDLWEYLKENKDIRIIHLTRWNRLRGHLSAKTAKTTGKWGIGATGGIATGDEKVVVTFDAAELERRFSAADRIEDEAREWFADHPMLEIVYEDIIADQEQELGKVMDFLSAPRRPTTTRTKKQSKDSLTEVISNYQELKNHFAGTKWAGFFDE